jgi:hypothetical protein
VPVTDLAPIHLARRLKYLSLFAVPIADYGQLAGVENLEELDLGEILSDQELPWSSLQSLKKITLRSPNTSLLLGASQINLERMVVHDPPEEETLSWVPSSIKSLEIWRSGETLNLKGISKLTGLTKFDSSNCAIVGSAELIKLPALREVIFYDSSGDYEAVLPALEAKGVRVKNWEGPVRRLDRQRRMG